MPLEMEKEYYLPLKLKPIQHYTTTNVDFDTEIFVMVTNHWQHHLP